MAVPEGMVVLDFVGFTDKGNYSSSEVYMENDLTHWKNTVWKCKADDTVNEEPSNSSVFWEVFIEGEKPVYGSYETFPRPGEVEKFYVDNTVDPRLMYTWDPNMNDYVLTGGAGGADGGSVDIPVTLTTTKWTGSTAPYSQEVILPQMREDMTPLHFLDGESDDMQYAYSLITDYEVSYGKITFYASDKPAVDIDLVLKGIPAQEVEYVDNTIIVPVQPSGFSLNSATNRYEQTIPVSGMTVGTSGTWDIIRSGPVLTLAESKLSANITDVERLDGAVKIICTELPNQSYMLSLSSTYAEATEGDTLLADMHGWFDKVNGIQSDISDEFSQSKAYTAGDYCIYLNRLYKFTVEKAAGQWDGTKVVPCTIGQELSQLNGHMGNINPIKDSVTNGDVVTTIKEKIECGQRTGTILFVDSSGLPGNLQHAVIQYMNPKGTSDIYLEASFVNNPRYYGLIAPNNNTPAWETYATNSSVRFYEQVPNEVTQIADLKAGVYFIPNVKMNTFTDLPTPNPGRSIIISGHLGGDEKPVLLIPSNNSHIYFGHRYGGIDTNYKWETI